MNILEEYLVRIGAEIDTNAFNGATRALNQLASILDRIGKSLKVGAIAALLAKITDSVIGNIRAVAKLDMEYQKLAKQMWVTKDTAKKLKVVLDTMGATEQDVAWIPELREQFMRLAEEMDKLATPEDAEGQLSWIRSIEYDVQSLQVKLKMFREWLVYYLIKYLEPFIKEVQEFIQYLNKQLGENMPALAKKVAKVLSQIVSVVFVAVKGIKALVGSVYDFFTALPGKAKLMATALAGVGALIMTGPFGAMLTAIGAALILMQDFYYYTKGWNSSKTLAPMWEWLMKDDNPIKNTINNIKESLGSILERLADIFTKVFTPEVRETLIDAIKTVAWGVHDIVNGIADLFKEITKDGPKANKFWDTFADGISTVVKRIALLSGVIGKLFSALGLALSGEFRKSMNALMDAADYAGKFGLDVINNVNDQVDPFTLSGNKAGADRAAALVASQPSSLLNDPNGCTRFIQAALGPENDFIKSLGGDLWVPNWVNKAYEMGRFVRGSAGMQRGDIIVTGDSDHVIMYDGNGGYYGNSTTQEKPVAGNLSRDFEGKIMGYIKTGSTIRDSYAANGPYKMGSSLAETFNKYPLLNGNKVSNSIGNITINISGAGDPKAVAEETMLRIRSVQERLQANSSYTGGFKWAF